GEEGTGAVVGRVVQDGGAGQGQGGVSPVEDAAAGGVHLAADDIQGGAGVRRVARDNVVGQRQRPGVEDAAAGARDQPGRGGGRRGGVADVARDDGSGQGERGAVSDEDATAADQIDTRAGGVGHAVLDGQPRDGGVGPGQHLQDPRGVVAA